MPFNLSDFLRAVYSCKEASSKLFYLLKKSHQLEGKVIFPEGDRGDSFCFRLQFVLPEGGTEHPIGGVSISIPPDASGNRASDGNPSTYEVMLLEKVPEGTDFFSDASLRSVYDPFGYDEQWGMTRFYDDDVNGLVGEILRLCNYLSLPLSSFPLHDHDESIDESNDLSKDESNHQLFSELSSLEVN